MIVDVADRRTGFVTRASGYTDTQPTVASSSFSSSRYSKYHSSPKRGGFLAGVPNFAFAPDLRCSTQPEFDLSRRLAELNATRGGPCNGILELALVLRQLTAMLLVGVSLLGPTSAVFACATGAFDADCCPEGSSVACNDEAPGLQQALPAACCVAAPAQSQKLTFESGRSARERDQNSGSPDLAINAGWLPPNRQFAHAHAAPHPGAPDLRIDGTLTYLLTGRLRL
jgi:hypothetical protein